LLIFTQKAKPKTANMNFLPLRGLISRVTVVNQLLKMLCFDRKRRVGHNITWNRLNPLLARLRVEARPVARPMAGKSKRLFFLNCERKMTHFPLTCDGVCLTSLVGDKRDRGSPHLPFPVGSGASRLP
jgi:hypothetical protein